MVARRRRSAGFTLIETLIVLGSVTVTILGVLTTHITCARLGQTNHETQLAGQSVRARMEELAAVDAGQIPALYDSDPSNDPGGAGTGMSTLFTAAGLSPDGAGQCGIIELPLDANGKVRENLSIPSLGMPRDLNGDGAVDGADHTADFVILPAAVRLRWKGLAGERELRLATVLVR